MTQFHSSNCIILDQFRVQFSENKLQRKKWANVDDLMELNGEWLWLHVSVTLDWLPFSVVFFSPFGMNVESKCGYMWIVIGKKWWFEQISGYAFVAGGCYFFHDIGYQIPVRLFLTWFNTHTHTPNEPNSIIKWIVYLSKVISSI